MGSEPSVYEKIRRVEVACKRLSVEIQNAIAIHAMWRRMDDYPDLLAAFRNTPEAIGLNVIQDVLIFRLISALTAVHDSPGRNRSSLPSVFKLLGDKAVIRHFIEEARERFPKIPCYTDRVAMVSAKSLMRAKVGWMRLKEGDGKTWLDTLRDFRNEHLAHLLFDMKKEKPAKYDYITNLLQRTVPIIDNLHLGLNGHCLELSDVKEICAKNADDFWAMVLRGMKAKKKRN